MAGGSVLCKRKHPAPALDNTDPVFSCAYDETRDGQQLCGDLPLDHLPQDVVSKVTAVIKRFSSVFSVKGRFVPVKNYEFEIDTGSARPIAVKKINYGAREMPIVRKCIAKLAELGQIRQLNGENREEIRGWLFKVILAPKPHQEHVYNIEDFSCRFCVSYTPLNQVTRVVAYPIPRCDTAIGLSFSDEIGLWLCDTVHGYHQIQAARDSQLKLAFQGVNATKWIYNVMPYGPINCPPVFISFIHDLDSTWKELASSEGIIINENTNSRIIDDEMFSRATSLDLALKYLICQLKICQSQNIFLNLKSAPSFQIEYNLWALTSVSSEITQPCTNLSSSKVGPRQQSSGTLQASSA